MAKRVVDYIGGLRIHYVRLEGFFLIRMAFYIRDQSSNTVEVFLFYRIGHE